MPLCLSSRPRPYSYTGSYRTRMSRPLRPRLVQHTGFEPIFMRRCRARQSAVALFVPQRHHGIDFGRPPRGDGGGEQRRGGKEHKRCPQRLL